MSIEMDLKDALQAIKVARGYLERGWCRGTSSKAENGETVPPSDPRAIAWCAVGGVVAAEKKLHLPYDLDGGVEFTPKATRMAMFVLNKAARDNARGGYPKHKNLMEFNDDNKRTKAQVLEFFDYVINNWPKLATAIPNTI